MQGYSGYSERQWQLKESALEPDLFLASDTLAPGHTGPASTAPAIEVQAEEVDDEASTTEGDHDAPDPQQRLDLPAPPREKPRESNKPRVNLFDIAYGAQ